MLLPLLLLALLLGGCSSENLPPAGTILSEGSKDMSAVKRLHLVLRVNGEPWGVNVRAVDGDVDSTGAGKGTLKVNFAGSLIEGDFVVVDNRGYFKGPTGKFEEYSIARTKALYDTTVVLDPDRGLAHVMAIATDTKTVKSEKVDGQKTYRITGKLTKDDVKPMVPGIAEDLTVVFWVAADAPHHLLKVWFSTPKADPAVPTVEVKLSQFDKPFDVRKPQL